MTTEETTQGPPIDPKEVLIGCISQRGESEQTRASLAALCQLGAGLLLVKNASPVALARNVLFARVLDELKPETPRRILLCFDDDIEATAQAGLQLAAHAKKTGNACSGVYVQAQGGSLQGVMYERETGVRDVLGFNTVPSWEPGLGFFAIPIEMLRMVAQGLKRLKHPAYRSGVFPFCCTGPHPDPARADEWCNEDAWLANLLPPPVEMLPIMVGHVRPVALYPSADDVARHLSSYEHVPEDHE